MSKPTCHRLRSRLISSRYDRGMAKYSELDTSQSPFKPKHGPSGPRCTETVPRALYGPVGMLPRCTLLDAPNGPHAGDHRANLSIPGIGKAMFRWKNKPRSRGHRASAVIVDDLNITAPKALPGNRPADLV